MIETKQETTKFNQTHLHRKPELHKQETPQEINSEKPNQTPKMGTLMDKIRKFSSKSPPKLPTNNQTRRITTNNKENPPKPNNIEAETKQEQNKTTRDTKTLMEIIKQKQTESKQQQSDRKQTKKTTKQQTSLKKQQNKTTPTRKIQEKKQNLPDITMYLAKKIETNEARAAAFNHNNKQQHGATTNKTSKEGTSASSTRTSLTEGDKPEQPIRNGIAAKGLQK